MPEPANIGDIQSIAREEALRSGKKLLGITATSPIYVAVPAPGVPGAQFEWVVDVYLLEGVSQQAIILGTGGGLTIIKDILIAHEASGDLISDVEVPVEIELLRTGQLQVVGRAKIAIPFLTLKEYTFDGLGLSHLSPFKEVDGILLDPFCVPASAGGSNPGTSTGTGVTIGVSVQTTTTLSTAGQLDEDDEGNNIDLEINPFQRVVAVTARQWTIDATETLRIVETDEEVT